MSLLTVCAAIISSSLFHDDDDDNNNNIIISSSLGLHDARSFIIKAVQVACQNATANKTWCFIKILINIV